jgi:hypothetical protein
VGHEDDDLAGQGPPQVADVRSRRRRVRVRGRLVEQDDVPVGEQRPGRRRRAAADRPAF